MGKKIVFIQGSPRRNGNTRTLAAEAISGAVREGAEVEQIDATALRSKIPGCTHCQKCKSSDHFMCSIDDEVSVSVASIPLFDIIVLSTPLYWWTYPAQLKIVIDRMYSLSKFLPNGEIRSLMKGKTLALFATAAGPLHNNLDLLEQQWKQPAAMLGAHFASCLFPDIPDHFITPKQYPHLYQKANEFGRSLLK